MLGLLRNLESLYILQMNPAHTGGRNLDAMKRLAGIQKIAPDKRGPYNNECFFKSSFLTVLPASSLMFAGMQNQLRRQQPYGRSLK